MSLQTMAVPEHRDTVAPLDTFGAQDCGVAAARHGNREAPIQ